MNHKQVADKIDKQLQEMAEYRRDHIDLPASVYREISRMLRNGPR